MYVRVVMVGVNILMCWRRESLLPCLYLPKAFGFLGGRPGFLRDLKCAHTCKIHVRNPHVHMYMVYVYHTVQLSSL